MSTTRTIPAIVEAGVDGSGGIGTDDGGGETVSPTAEQTETQADAITTGDIIGTVLSVETVVDYLDRAESVDLSPTERQALYVIGSPESVTTQADVWKTLDISSRAGSRIVRGLVDAGLVTREQTVSGGSRTYAVRLAPVAQMLDANRGLSFTELVSRVSVESDPRQAVESAVASVTDVIGEILCSRIVTDAPSQRYPYGFALIVTGDVSTQSELWKALGVSSRTGTRIGRWLETHGYIERSRETAGQSYEVRLSETAADALRKAFDESGVALMSRYQDTPIESMTVVEMPLAISSDTDGTDESTEPERSADTAGGEAAAGAENEGAEQQPSDAGDTVSDDGGEEAEVAESTTARSTSEDTETGDRQGSTDPSEYDFSLLMGGDMLAPTVSSDGSIDYRSDEMDTFIMSLAEQSSRDDQR